MLINKNDLFFIKKKELNINNNISITNVLSKYNNTINFYKLNNDYNDIFDINNKNLKGININVSEQVFMISKIINYKSYNTDIIQSYNDLLNFKFNPYVNFNTFNAPNYNNINFNHLFNNIIRSVRLSNIEFKNNNILHIRNIGENIDANIVGFILVPNNCYKYKTLLYNTSKLKELNINNIKKVLKTLNGKNKYLYY